MSNKKEADPTVGDIGDKVRYLRSIHDLSQEQFSAIFSRKRAWCSKIESKLSTPRYSVLLGICREFSVPMSWLTGSDENLGFEPLNLGSKLRGSPARTKQVLAAPTEVLGDTGAKNTHSGSNPLDHSDNGITIPVQATARAVDNSSFGMDRALMTYEDDKYLYWLVEGDSGGLVVPDGSIVKTLKSPLTNMESMKSSAIVVFHPSADDDDDYYVKMRIGVSKRLQHIGSGIPFPAENFSAQGHFFAVRAIILDEEEIAEIKVLGEVEGTK